MTQLEYHYLVSLALVVVIKPLQTTSKQVIKPPFSLFGAILDSGMVVSLCWEVFITVGGGFTTTSNNRWFYLPVGEGKVIAP